MSNLEQPSLETADIQNTAVSSAETTVTTDTTATDSWLNRLPEDLKTNPSLTKFKDDISAFKAYVELEKSMGGKVKLPGDNATPEEINNFFNKIGRPETKDGYEFNTVLDDKPELVKSLLSDRATEFADLAHQLGLPKTTATKLLAWQAEKLEAQLETLAEQTAAAKDRLTKAWGAETDTKIAEAERAAEILAKDYPEEMAAFKDSDAARNPVTMIMLSELAQLYKEKNDGVLGESSSPSLSAREELDALKKADRSHPLWNDRHPQHKEAVARYNELYQILGQAQQ